MNEWEWHLLEDKKVLSVVEIDGWGVVRGDPVCVRPHSGGFVLVLALSGCTAVFDSLLLDYEC
jgi:hypothetical protein